MYDKSYTDSTGTPLEAEKADWHTTRSKEGRGSNDISNFLRDETGLEMRLLDEKLTRLTKVTIGKMV